MTETNHGYVGYMLTVNPDFWGSLPVDVRDELEAIIQEVSVWVNEESVNINLAGREKIVASGRTEVTELTDAGAGCLAANHAPCMGNVLRQYRR